MTGTLQWVVRVTSEVENNTVSVEKIQEYTETPTEVNISKYFILIYLSINTQT